MTAPPASDVKGSHSDPVHHPKHYNSHPSGIECVEFSELLPGNLSHACVYVWRHANKGQPEEDLEKAQWFIDREAGRTVSERLSARELLGLTDGSATWSDFEPEGVRVQDRLRPLERFVKEKEFVATVVYRLLRYELAEARTLITHQLKALRAESQRP
jgi:hypothetical protein